MDEEKKEGEGDNPTEPERNLPKEPVETREPVEVPKQPVEVLKQPIEPVKQPIESPKKFPMESFNSEQNLTNKIRKNPWILSTLVFGVIALTLLIANFSGGVTGNVVSEVEAGENLVGYLNTVADSEVTLVDIEDDGNFYQVTIEFRGEEISMYVTKDGAYYTNSLVPITAELPSEEEEQSSQMEEQDIVDVSVDDDAIKGDVNAPVTIVEFSDYECPFCARHFEETLPLIIEEYVDTGKVRIVFRDFPLEFHSYAQKASEAAECAGEQEKYWEMHDTLFENQKNLDVDSLKKYAEDIGLNTGEFDNCLDSDEMADEVKKDMEDGKDYGVSGTPGNFINGRFVSGAQPFSVFQQIIEEELAKS